MQLLLYCPLPGSNDKIHSSSAGQFVRHGDYNGKGDGFLASGHPRVSSLGFRDLDGDVRDAEADSKVLDAATCQKYYRDWTQDLCPELRPLLSSQEPSGGPLLSSLVYSRDPDARRAKAT
ncbi:hypothetical protein GW7_19375 [Heterocephalus glaber]|uniref:Uncharacterized protein n=1 Tax=Heterocephalus glaber TaxID=10181 RepID=G5C9Q5_HETGA|nr:hypothetical protein GW7_19375 [Heterocephalus glaber]